MASLLEEARALSDAGVRSSSSSRRTSPSTVWTCPEHKRLLPELLRELCKMDFTWIRLHYLYPDQITDELIDVIADEPENRKSIWIFRCSMSLSAFCVPCTVRVTARNFTRPDREDARAYSGSCTAYKPDRRSAGRDRGTSLPSCVSSCRMSALSVSVCSSIRRRKARRPQSCPTRSTTRPSRTAV